MDIAKYAWSCVCCSLAVCILRSEAQLTPWLAITARTIAYLAIYVLPAVYVLKGQAQQLRQPTTTAAAMQRTAEVHEATASVDSSPLPSSLQHLPTSQHVSALGAEEQLCLGSDPVALSSDQQRCPLQPAELSLRDWKSRSTTGGSNQSWGDGANSSFSAADGVCYASSCLGPSDVDLSVGFSQSGLKPSCSSPHVHIPVPAAELDYSTSDVCLSMPAPCTALGVGSPAALSSARSEDLSAEASGISAASAVSSVSSPLGVFSNGTMERTAAAPTTQLFESPPAATAGVTSGNSCSHGDAIGEAGCRTAALSSHSWDSLVQAVPDASCSTMANPRDAVPATTAMAASCGAVQSHVNTAGADSADAVALSLEPYGKAQPASSRASASSCSLRLRVAASVSKCQSAGAGARQAVASAQQHVHVFNYAAAGDAAAFFHATAGADLGALAAAAGDGDGVLQGGPDQHYMQPAALQAAVGYTAAAHVGHGAAIPPLPTPPDLTIITLRRTVSAQQLLQQHDEQPGTEESVLTSEGSVDQPSTPVFVTTSSRFLQHTSTGVASAGSGCLGCGLSSSGVQSPLPLPSPADSPLARRVTNERDEQGFPLSPGLVELLQQREQRGSHGLCSADDQLELQQLAPWAGLQLRSVSQRLCSGESGSCRAGSVGSCCLSCSSSMDDSSITTMASSSNSSAVSSSSTLGCSRFRSNLRKNQTFSAANARHTVHSASSLMQQDSTDDQQQYSSRSSGQDAFESSPSPSHTRHKSLPDALEGVGVDGLASMPYQQLLALYEAGLSGQ